MTIGEKLREILGAALSFSVRERRGILWFIPVIMVLSLVVASLSRPRMERSLQAAADSLTVADPHATKPLHTTHYDRQEEGARQDPARKLFRFDPNTVDYRGLRTLGFSARAAAGIIKYRESGKVFRIKEEFAACWDVGDSLYYILEPYIIISPQFAPGKREQTQNAGAGESAASAATAATATATAASAGPSPWRQGRIRVELNSADTSLLTAVNGIGSLTAARIVDYRTRLGGFVRIGQLAEIKGMTEQNYDRIVQQIFIDSAGISKIDINFAAPEKLAGHPYISPEMMRRILKNRQLKGGWSSLNDMTKDGTLTDAQAARLEGYLEFNPNHNF